MDEQSRPEGAADEHTTEPGEAVPATAPHEPADTPSSAAAASSPDEPTTLPGLMPDLRIHPWQVIPPSLLELVPANPSGDAAQSPSSPSEPQALGSSDDDAALAEPVAVMLPPEQVSAPPAAERWTLLPDEAADSAAPAPLERPPAAATPIHEYDFAPHAEQSRPLPDANLEAAAPVAAQSIPTPIEQPDTVALLEEQDTIEVFEEQVAILPNGEAVVVSSRAVDGASPAPAPLENALVPPVFAGPVAPTPAPLSTPAAPSDAASPLALFTAATVPPGEPAGKPPSDLPRIPVDPSAETVPLSVRTGEVVPVSRAYPGYPGYPGSPQVQPSGSRFAALRQPLTRDAVVRFLTAACGTIVLAAMLGLLFTRGEWATGLAAAAIAALLVALAYLVGTLARAGAAERKANTLRLGLTATVIFALLGGTGLALSGMLHQAQAGVMASVGDYSGAVREYQLAGDGPPNADLAAAYVGWGNELLQKGDFAGAAAAFQPVVEQYAATPSARAGGLGLLRADKGWLAVGGASLPYLTMLRDLAAVRTAAYCDSSCAASAATLSAQAFIDYGIALNGQQRYTQAIAQFEAVTRFYASTALAPTAHEDAAVTYFVYGQDQRAGKVCADAVPTFQSLASSYADTPEGAAAKTALAAPVQVIGSLTGYPKNPVPIMFLSKTIRGDSYFSDDYSAKLDANGNFTFSGVAPGNYNLSAAVPSGAGVYWVDPNTKNPYNITVGPLCTLTLQPYSYA